VSPKSRKSDESHLQLAAHAVAKNAMFPKLIREGGIQHLQHVLLNLHGLEKGGNLQVLFVDVLSRIQIYKKQYIHDPKSSNPAEPRMKTKNKIKDITNTRD